MRGLPLAAVAAAAVMRLPVIPETATAAATRANYWPIPGQHAWAAGSAGTPDWEGGRGVTANAGVKGCCCRWRACACAARPGASVRVLRTRPESAAMLCQRCPRSRLSCSAAVCRDPARLQHPSRSLSGRAIGDGSASCMLSMPPCLNKEADQARAQPLRCLCSG